MKQWYALYVLLCSYGFIMVIGYGYDLLPMT